MKNNHKTIFLFLCVCVLVGFFNQPFVCNSSANEYFPLQSKITKITWKIIHLEWYPYEGENYGNHSAITFTIAFKIVNSEENDVTSDYHLYLQYSGTFPEEYQIWGGPNDPYPNNVVFQPGVNYREWDQVFLIKDMSLDEPLSGKYTFWVTDTNHTIISYEIKILTFYNSSFVNFLVYDYEYIIIGVVSLAVLGVVSWYSVKKIHFLRLNPILTRKLDDIKFITDQANFTDAGAQLEEILPEIEQLNKVAINQRWNELKKRCTMNLEMQNKIDSINKENGKELKKDKLLALLKEIHTPQYKDYIDPSIESEIVESIKKLN